MREREVPGRDIIIRFNNSPDLPEENTEKDKSDAMDVVVSRPDVFTGNVRSHWTQLLIELAALRSKKAIDPFVFWLQQPNQEELLNKIHGFIPVPITPIIIATVGSGENFEDLFEKIKQGPGVNKVSPSWRMDIIEPVKSG